MTNQSSTEPVELETADAQYWVELSESLIRLEDNEDFKKLILSGYIKDKALDSVSLLAVPAMKRAGERPDIMEDLIAISNLQYYFKMVKNFGAMAKEDLETEEFGE
jgi:hypothetical protein